MIRWETLRPATSVALTRRLALAPGWLRTRTVHDVGWQRTRSGLLPGLPAVPGDLEAVLGDRRGSAPCRASRSARRTRTAPPWRCWCPTAPSGSRCPASAAPAKGPSGVVGVEGPLGAHVGRALPEPVLALGLGDDPDAVVARGNRGVHEHRGEHVEHQLVVGVDLAAELVAEDVGVRQVPGRVGEGAHRHEHLVALAGRRRVAVGHRGQRRDPGPDRTAEPGVVRRACRRRRSGAARRDGRTRRRTPSPGSRRCAPRPLRWRRSGSPWSGTGRPRTRPMLATPPRSGTQPMSSSTASMPSALVLPRPL